MESHHTGQGMTNLAKGARGGAVRAFGREADGPALESLSASAGVLMGTVVT